MSVKAMIAVFAAGVLAGVIAVLPLIIPDQEPTKPIVAAAATDARAPSETPVAEDASADPCAGQTWPYIDSACADAKAREQDTRQVRVISTDRAAPTTLATRTPRIEPKKPESPTSAPQPPATAAAAPPPQVAPEPSVPPAPTQAASAPVPVPTPETKPATAEFEQATVSSTPTTEAKVDARPDAKPNDAEPNGTAKVHTAAAPAEPAPAAEHAPRKTKAVTVSSKRAKRSKPQPIQEHPAAPSEPTRELARGRTQPVADPGRSLGGPTVVRTYDYADGRRVTVYRPADRGTDGQAMAFGGERGGSRRVLVPMED